jgi:nucleotide-binding universal stress UspA family protein
VRTVLVPVDGSEPALRAVRSVADLARSAPGMIAILLHVEPTVSFVERLFNGSPSDQRRIEGLLRDKGHDFLAPAQAELDRAGVRHTALVEFGDPAAVIAARAKDWDVDLIVVGTRGLDAAGRFLPGSVAQKVLHQADVPVMLVK